MAASVNNLDDLTRQAAAMKALADKWDASVRSGFSI